MSDDSLRIAWAVGLVLQLAAPGASLCASGDTGRALPIVASAGIGPTMDVATDGDRLFAVGQGRLSVLDIRQPAAPKLLGRLDGLGQVRQVTVHEGVAYVTAREDGLFLIDVTRPDAPQLLSHYDTIELATGIAVSGKVAFVACRNCGVELVDVTDGRQPRHLSTIRVGEAQSVAVRDGILYAGVWATREVAICDARNPRRPHLLAKAPLDGYGDGVALRGHYCYVATGHHRRGLPCEKPGDPGYGGGHGLEIFDVTDPGRPRFVGRVKLPPLYRLGYDTWRVTVGERFAFVADTFNGVFVVDVSEPRAPRVVARGHLPQVPERGDPSPAAGIAVTEGAVFAAGAWTDLHVLDAPRLAARSTPNPDRGVAIPPPETTAAVRGCRAYRPDGQVHSVALHGNVALVAAGAAGIHVVEVKPDWRRRAAIPTAGFAFDVRVCGDRVFVAEGKGGLSIWAQEGETLRRLGQYDARGQSVRQVVVPPPGKYALIHVGPNTLEVLDVSNPRQSKQVFEDCRLGLFYTAPIADGLLDGRFACCHWHVTGLYWYDLYGGPRPQYSGRNYAHRIGSQNGVAFWDRRALLVAGGKYSLVDSEESRPPHELPQYGVEGAPLSGKPTVAGNRLYVSERYSGLVQALDVTEIQRPRLLGRLQLAEHPGIVCDLEGTALIPAGYEGLVAWQAAGFANSADTDRARTAEDRAAFAASVRRLADRYWRGFGSPQTELAYHHRLNGPRGLAALSSPAEIAQGTVAGKPMPHGYGSGIQDVSLENGQLLYALCEAYDAMGEPWMAEAAGRAFRGLQPCRRARTSTCVCREPQVNAATQACEQQTLMSHSSRRAKALGPPIPRRSSALLVAVGRIAPRSIPEVRHQRSSAAWLPSFRSSGFGTPLMEAPPP